MSKKFILYTVAVGIAWACLGCPRIGTPGDSENENENAAEVVTTGLLNPGLLDAYRRELAAIADRKLGRAAFEAPGLFTAPEGRALFSDVVACAIPSNSTVRAGDLDYFGELGLAPEWSRGALGPRERRWIAACLAARSSGLRVLTVISLRGPHPALRPGDDERADPALEDGAFYGRAIGGDAGALWACRGTGAASGELLDRVCAHEDPARPGFTLCGFSFAGDCVSACRRREHGTYRDCRAGDDKVTEVITVFAQP